jgi:ribosomal protein L21E
MAGKKKTSGSKNCRGAPGANCQNKIETLLAKNIRKPVKMTKFLITLVCLIACCLVNVSQLHLLVRYPLFSLLYLFHHCAPRVSHWGVLCLTIFCFNRRFSQSNFNCQLHVQFIARFSSFPIFSAMPHSFGYRARTRDMFAKDYKTAGQIPLTRYLTTYKLGDYVDIKADGAIHKGMPHKYYHGRTGIVWNVTKSAVGVIVRYTLILLLNISPQSILHFRSTGFPFTALQFAIFLFALPKSPASHSIFFSRSQVNKQVRNRIIKKKIHVRIEHVKKSNCRKQFLDRLVSNEIDAKMAKNEGSTSFSINRKPLMSVVCIFVIDICGIEFP